MADSMVTRTLIKRRLAKVLRGFGIDAPENMGLHSWRCAPQYNNGKPCHCFDELIDALTAAVEHPLNESFDLKAWLDANNT